MRISDWSSDVCSSDLLLVDIGEWCETRLPKLFGDAMSLVIDNRIFKQRNVDIATVSKEDALAWGFSGPMIRGSGITWDIRKSKPYDAFAAMVFDIPVGPRGDCSTRFNIGRASCGERGGD